MRRLVSAPRGLAFGWVGVVGLALTSFVGLQSCGPSFEAIQEGDLRFAHCDRLDFDQNVGPSHRLHCWREWGRVYTYGQTRDRVDYAQRRIAEVVSGDTDPPFELPTEVQTPNTLAKAQPSPVHSPPPAVVPITGAPSLARDADGVSPVCRSRCEAERTTCFAGCDSQPTGCRNCETSLEVCLSNCKAGEP
jgi:hypothetical protein